MVAVLTVLSNHLWGWPRGGFVGVDVFFVISGFLITGILLRDADKIGHVSFIEFYRRRVRRIVPAATLTLAAITLVSFLMYAPSRAAEVWRDAFAAFFFVSNWRFAVEGTDYFAAEGAISPVRHFWSLSVEEQFYFVWPAVMAVIVVLAARKGRSAREFVAGGLMATIVVASFTWAVIDTANSPTWSYFSTLTRVWELGVGTLIAIFAARMTQIPEAARPFIAWSGLALIGFGVLWITEDIGFPGPWAAIPVVGSALVLIAGTGGPVKHLPPITNKVSTTIGDMSYSLYLWHWPVIIFLGSYADGATGWWFYTAAIGLTAGLSILAYYFVEQPILASSWLKPRRDQRSPPRRRGGDTTLTWWWRNLSSRATFQFTEMRSRAALAGLLAAVVGASSLLAMPYKPPTYISTADVGAPEADQPLLPPAVASLQQQITAAVKARTWPRLKPSMEAVLSGPDAAPEAKDCTRAYADCWFGNPDAPKTVVLVGDSIAMGYLAPLAHFVDASGGQWRLLYQAAVGCHFLAADAWDDDPRVAASCPGAKKHALDNIRELRPEVVLISNHYGEIQNAATREEITYGELRAGLQGIVEQVSGLSGRVGLIAAPPADRSPVECYRPDDPPSNCVGRVLEVHNDRRRLETEVSQGFDNVEVIDTRLLFCTASAYCPMFVGDKVVKFDRRHLTPGYSEMIGPALTELLNGTATFG